MNTAKNQQNFNLEKQRGAQNLLLKIRKIRKIRKIVENKETTDKTHILESIIEFY